jgi:predicted unusual protein kinase regulating ubiquinone biosynthesis (AarF/ABC1/UbiB family)
MCVSLQDLHPGNILVREAGGGNTSRSTHTNASTSSSAPQSSSSSRSSSSSSHPQQQQQQQQQVQPARTWLGWCMAGLRSLSPPPPPKLVLLDTGMTAQLTPSDQGHLIAFFRALTMHDGEQLGRAILEMSEQYTCKVCRRSAGEGACLRASHKVQLDAHACTLRLDSCMQNIQRFLVMVNRVMGLCCAGS